MRILNATLVALSLVALVGCGKKEDKKEETKVSSGDELAARAKVYSEIPKATLIRVEIDPQTGEEKLDTVEIKQSSAVVSDVDAVESTFASASVLEQIDENSDDYNSAMDNSNDSFFGKDKDKDKGAKRIPWLLRTPMFKWGFRQGYRKGVTSGYVGDFKDAYYGAGDGYTGSPKQMPPQYNFAAYSPACLYGGYQWHYGPQYVRDNGNYRYYAYAPQGAEYYSEGIYQDVVNNPYSYGAGIYGKGQYAAGVYTNSYSASYNSWNACSGQVVQSTTCCTTTTIVGGMSGC